MEEKKKPNTTLELNIISCNNLKSTFSFSRKLNTYVTVSVVKDDDRSNPKHHTPIHSQKTPTDRNGDRNPQWNHSMNFNFQTIPDDRVFSLEFIVMCENSLIGGRKVGDARLPLEDLQFDKIWRSSVLSVKNSDGKERGKLNISWKFSGERAKIEEDKIVQMKSCSSMKFDADTYLRAMQAIKWPIKPLVSLKEISCRDGSCNDKILCPLEMKSLSLSFNTGFDQLGKDCKNYSVSGSTKWEIELDPRAGRFPGLLARNLSECSFC